jgi:hypothetical protein
MEYTLKEDKSKEEGLNEFDSIIEITGLHSEVTINNLLDHLENTQKVLKEQVGQIKANEMLMEKAVEELPILKDIPEDKANLALSYFGKIVANKQAEELIKVCEETIEIYTEHLKGIEKATGIKCLPEVSPYQVLTVEENKANE